jgi:capsular polysaccharide transport system permease protein
MSEQQARSIATPRSNTRAGLRLASRSLTALLIREILSRYGRTNLAFLWLIVEPLILCVGVMVIWSFIRHDSHGIPLISFIVSGYMPLTLWRHISSHAVTCIRHNTALLYHRGVRPLDLVIVSAILEFLGTSMALIAVFVTLRLAGLVEPQARIDLMIAGWLFMAWLSFAVGLILSSLSEQYDFIEKLVAPFQYLMLPISGCFFMVGWLPTWTQRLALYVPTVHCYEMFRAGLLGEGVETYFSMFYMTTVCLIATGAGLTMMLRVAASLHFE